MRASLPSTSVLSERMRRITAGGRTVSCIPLYSNSADTLLEQKPRLRRASIGTRVWVKYYARGITLTVLPSWAGHFLLRRKELYLHAQG